MPDALSDAKAALAHAKNSGLPSLTPTPAAAAPAKPAAPAKATPTLGDELNAKAGYVQKGRQAAGLPKMHNGGPVLADGAYQLKAGEHVLTEPEAKLARKHAILASGMRSLTQPGSKAKKS